MDYRYFPTPTCCRWRSPRVDRGDRARDARARGDARAVRARHGLPRTTAVLTGSKGLAAYYEQWRRRARPQGAQLDHGRGLGGANSAQIDIAASPVGRRSCRPDRRVLDAPSTKRRQGSLAALWNGERFGRRESSRRGLKQISMPRIEKLIDDAAAHPGRSPSPRRQGEASIRCRPVHEGHPRQGQTRSRSTRSCAGGSPRRSSPPRSLRPPPWGHAAALGGPATALVFTAPTRARRCLRRPRRRGTPSYCRLRVTFQVNDDKARSIVSCRAGTIGSRVEQVTAGGAAPLNDSAGGRVGASRGWAIAGSASSRAAALTLARPTSSSPAEPTPAGRAPSPCCAPPRPDPCRDAALGGLRQRDGASIRDSSAPAVELTGTAATTAVARPRR